jgi:hypothetical protein
VILDKKYISVFFLILLCFPFVPFLGFFPKSDAGIHVLILSFFSFFLMERKVPKYVILILSLIVISFVIKADLEFNQFARFISGFLIHCSVFILVYNLLKVDPQLFKKCLFIIYFSYLLGAFLQLLSPEIFKSIFFFIRSSSNRGLTSFASEPSSFALNCYLILLCLKMMGLKSKLFYLNLLLVIVLSLNSVIFFISFFAFILSYTLKLKFKNLIILVLVVLGFIYLISDLEFLVQSRIFRNVKLFFNNPEILLLDSSINRRLAHILFPIIGLFKGYFLFPHFDMEYTKYVFELLSNDYPLFSSEIGGNIMSGVGQLIINLGLLGLLIFFVIIFKIFQSIKISFFIKFSILFIFINSISISWATFAIIISLIYYNDKKYLHRRT